MHRIATCALLLSAFGAANALCCDLFAQSIHLPPPAVTLPPYIRGAFPTLLRITAAPDTTKLLSVNSKIRIYGGRLWILGSGGRSDSIQVVGQTIQAIANHINANYEGARAETHYPEYDGRHLDNMLPRSLPDTGLAIKGSLGGPQVDATLGAVFSLSDVEERFGNNRVFSSGGIQLDLVGQQALRKNVFLRLRMTFSSNDPQPVQAESTEPAADSGTPQPSLRQATVTGSLQQNESTVTSIIENTERFSLGGQIDFYVVDRTGVKLGFGVEYEMGWNSFDPLPFPTAVVDTETVSVESLYPQERVDAVRRKVNRVLPASTLFFGSAVRFPALSGLSVHALLSFGVSERFTRKIDFQPIRDPDPQTLRDGTTSELKPVWRFGIGMTLGSVLDVRADALGPLGSDDDFDPVIRVFVSKEFSVKK